MFDTYFRMIGATLSVLYTGVGMAFVLMMILLYASIVNDFAARCKGLVRWVVLFVRVVMQALCIILFVIPWIYILILQKIGVSEMIIISLSFVLSCILLAYFYSKFKNSLILFFLGGAE